MNRSAKHWLLLSANARIRAKCPCGIKSLKSQVQSDLHGLNQLNKTGEKKQMSAEKPVEAPVAPEAPAKAGTELTYQQFEDALTKNTTQIMDACKAAIAESTKKLEAKLETDVKAAVAALIPKAKPTGKGQVGNFNAGLPMDDAQRLNNIFAKKGNMGKAGLELAAAAKRMGGLNADVTHTDEEEGRMSRTCLLMVQDLKLFQTLNRLSSQTQVIQLQP